MSHEIYTKVATIDDRNYVALTDAFDLIALTSNAKRWFGG